MDIKMLSKDCRNFSENAAKADYTYGVVVKDERVLVFVKVIERSLWNTILDLYAALDILLV